MKARKDLHKVAPLSSVPSSKAKGHVKAHHGPKTKRIVVTCKVFWNEYKVQAAEILKTATAIVVALLWSTTITSLFDSIFAGFYLEADYTPLSLGVSFAFVSVLIAALIPVIAFKYVQPDDYWAVVLLIEILGHLWGFKIKDIIVHVAYRQHYLYQAFAEHSVDIDTDFSYCNLVSPEFVFVSTDINFDAVDLGWEGYNLDWTSYAQNRSVFDGYYDQDPCDLTPSPSPANTTNTTSATRRELGSAQPAPNVDCSSTASRRHLAAAAIPAPSPYEGPLVDLELSNAIERGPGRTCNFEYRTTQVLKGFRVERSPRFVYWAELGSRILIWIICLGICILSVVTIRAIYNKLVLPNCCKKSMTHEVKHNWSHIQNHLIADAWANGMGWASSWFFWWLTLCIILLISNLGETSPCNGMHAFPLASAIAGLSVFFALVALLLYLRIHIWARTLVCCPRIKAWLGGLGELQNGFMLGWFLIAWVTYFHSTFISPYLEDGFEDYSPFDDIYETHHTPTLPLALEELAEALVWTGAGLLYLTSQKLQIKASHRETTLLKEAKRRLHNYFALTGTFATTITANQITKLVDERKQWAQLMEKRALIETRAIGIWMGLTIELAIHLFISLLETKTLEVYYGTSGNSYGSYYGYGASYSSYYSATSSPYAGSGYGGYSSYGYSYGYGGSHDYTAAAIEQSIVFAMNFAVSAALTAVFFAVMFCSHHMSWRISSERERKMAVLVQRVFRKFRLHHKSHFAWRRSSRQKSSQNESSDPSNSTNDTALAESKQQAIVATHSDSPSVSKTISKHEMVYVN